MEMILANSADSHLMEPADLWTSRLPADLADRAPRSEKTEKYETIYLDGQKMYRALAAFTEAIRPPGATDLGIRLHDLDREGVRFQLAFPSMGLWLANLQDAALQTALVRAWNDWAVEEVISRTDRVLPSAILPFLSVEDAVEEVQRVKRLGFRVVFLPSVPPGGVDYAFDRWEPLWSAVEESGIVLGFHIGTGGDPVVYRGPGGAIINYWETTVPGQRVVTHLVASGALDRHPQLNVLIAEGGCSWVPALADRLDEAYRQHGMYVEPKLSMLPSEIIYRQVYTSFQHDQSAVPAYTAMGYHNIMWGDDYPHLEGTYGHTQETLHKLFDGAPEDAVRAITTETFERLFHTPSLNA
jgi:predicted TIM-barrel fold metal-dependent hydrolase